MEKRPALGKGLSALIPDLPEPTPEENAKHDEIRKELAKVQDRFRGLVEKSYGPKPVKDKEEREKIEKELQEVSGRMQGLRAKLPPEYENHGWVWLFKRKPVELSTAR